MKNYLNNSEEKELIVICTAKNLTEHFSKGNLVTKTELADMRRGTSFLMKSVESMLKRLDQKYVDKFLRLAKSSKTVVVSECELDVIKKRKDAELNAAYEDNKEYFDLVEITMDMNCKNCTRDFCKCDLFKHFDEQEVIPFNEKVDLGNCKFAYKGCDVNEDKNSPRDIGCCSRKRIKNVSSHKTQSSNSSKNWKQKSTAPKGKK